MKQGRKESTGLKEFRALSDFDIIKLMSRLNQSDIADMYNLTKSTVSLEMTKRNFFQVREVNRFKEVPELRECLSLNEDDYGLNYWMESQERISINQYYLIIN